MSGLKLASEFDEASRENWRMLVDALLKGADFEKKLVWKSHDDLAIQPLYDEPVSAPIPASSTAGWKSLQRVDMPNVAAANAQALEDLNGGTAGLALMMPDSPSANGFGVNAPTVDDMASLLENIYLEMIPVRLDAGWAGRNAALSLIEVYAQRGVDLAEADLCLGLDPLGALAFTGQMRTHGDVQAATGAMMSTLLARNFAGTAFVGDGRVYHNAGASEAQELAFALATALNYIRWMEAEGIALDVACRATGMVLNVDADMFMSTAKLRAARLVWQRLQEAMGVAATPLVLHGETSWRMLTRKDAHVNMLRATAATFAAAIAGVDSLTVHPFTSALGLPDAFARRMARNVQNILNEESHLGLVQDPGAGSGFMDQTALDLAVKAWEIFQDIERQGGMLSALTNEHVAKLIAPVRDKRQRNLATRREPITGISEFPNLGELPVEVLSDRQNTPKLPDDPGEMCKPLHQMRLAEGYEALRDASDKILADTGVRPSIFMANMGRVADFTARATWAANVFEAGGIEALRNEGFETPEDAANAFSESGANIAIICSSDALYDDISVSTAAALKNAGAKQIYLAGKRNDEGVDTYVHMGCDILSLLTQAHALLGIEK
ncbi:MAG: methylmalonyl-CoA mutase family protein [Hyphomicrobiales bacterium]